MTARHALSVALGISLAAASVEAETASSEVPEQLRHLVTTVDTPNGTQAVLRGGVSFNVSASNGTREDAVDLSWSAAPGLNVYFIVSRDGQELTWLSSQDSTYTDPGTNPLVSHEYAVSMRDVDNGFQMQVGMDEGFRGFFAPGNLVATDYTDLTAVSLSWEDRSDIEDGFVIRRDGAVIDSVAANTLSYRDLTANPLTPYEYCVSAYRNGVESALLGQAAVPDPVFDISVENWNGSSPLPAWVVDGESLRIFDVSNPAAPVARGTLPAVGSNGVVQGGNSLGFVQNDTGFLVVDATDIDAPFLFDSFDTMSPPTSITATDPSPDFGTEEILITEGLSGFSMWFTTKGSFFETGRVDTDGNALGAALLRSDFAFIADGPEGLAIYDIRPMEEGQPAVFLGSLQTPGVATDVDVYGDRAVVAAGAAGAHLIDISDYTSPRLLHTYPGTFSSVEMNGSYAALSGNSSPAVVVEAMGPMFTELSVTVPGDSRGASIVDGVAYFGVIVGGGGGGQIVSVRLPTTVATGATCDPGVQGTIEPPSTIAATLGYHLDKTVITWVDNSTAENGFRIERETSGVVELVANVAADVTSYEDFTGLSGVPYTYRVSVLDSGDNPLLGGTAPGGRGPDLMPAPGNLVASDLLDSDEYVRLTWGDTPAEDFFVVYRALQQRSGGGIIADSIAVVGANITTYDDVSGTPHESYSYYVQARSNAGGNSVFSNEDTGSREDILPPANVVASDGDFETHTTITWENRSQKTVLFRISRDGTEIQTVTGTATSTEDALGTPGQVHVYRVEAVSATGIASSAEDVGNRTLLAPTDVSAEDDVVEDRVRVTWTDNSMAETGYRIYRDGTEIATTFADRGTYTDLTGVPGTSYTYEVAAYDAIGESDRISDTGIRVLKAPTNVVASDGTSETSVTITWDDNSVAETGYIVLRDGFQWASTLPANSTSIVDNITTVGQVRTYTVQAIDALGSSAVGQDTGFSDIVPPGAVTASDTYADVVISWTDESNLEDEYVIYRDGVLLATVPANTTQYIDNSLTDFEEPHEYCVAARDTGTGREASACAIGQRSDLVTYAGLNVSASGGSYDDRVRVEWTSGEPVGLTEFEIYRDLQLIDTIDGALDSYNDFDAVTGTAHEYAVVGVNAAGTQLESGSAAGWTPADGAINGRITTRSGAAVDSIRVCLTPSLAQSLAFEGSVGGVAMPAHSDLTTAFTVEYWMKSSATTGGTTFSYAAAGQDDEIRIFRQGSGQIGVFVHNVAATLNGFPYDGDWHHVAIVWDNTSNGSAPNLFAYVDGVLASSASFQDGLVLSAPGTTWLGQDHAFDGSTSFADRYQGLLDEIRVWDVARTQPQIQATMNAALTGSEFGLVQYWPAAAGQGRGLADLTGRGVDGVIVGGVEWTPTGAPIDVCALSDIDGNYELAGLRYGASTDFRVTPMGTDRAFDPPFKTITLDEQSPIQNEVGFSDVTAFSLNGTFTYQLAPSCTQADVPLYIDGELAGSTRADGTFSLAAQPGTRIIEPRLEGHTFSPPSITVEVSADLAGLDFVNTTTRLLSGRIGGGCNASIGEWRFNLMTENGCYATTIQADGAFQMQVAPLAMVATVDQLTGAVPPPLSEGDILAFFQNVGSFAVDLTAGDATLDLVYKAPLTMVIEGFPADCPTDFFDPESGVTSKAAPIIAQTTQVPLTIRVYEDYGNVQCPVDTGTVSIWDEIIDRGDTPTVLQISNGMVQLHHCGQHAQRVPRSRGCSGQRPLVPEADHDRGVG